MGSSIKVSVEDICFYLTCGFLPTEDKGFISKYFKHDDSVAELKSHLEILNEQQLIGYGKKSFLSAFDSDEIANGQHIVPLSGGLDSRAVLGGLLEVCPKENIRAVSFGQNDSYDFQIAKKVAQKAGIEHVKIDLDSIEFDENIFLKLASHDCYGTFLLDGYINYFIPQFFGDSVTYWSGFLGGEIAGSHIPINESKSWDLALNHFLSNNFLKQNVSLTYPGYEPKKSLRQRPFADNFFVSFDDQLDFGYRQNNYIRKVVLFDSYDYQTPFLNENWVRFMLGVPRQNRINKLLFQKVLLNSFPTLFTIPVAHGFGGKLDQSKAQYLARKVLNKIYKRYSNRSEFKFLFGSLFNSIGIYQNLNYFNYDSLIRESEDFSTLLKKSVMNLHERQCLPWLDMENLLKQQSEEKIKIGFSLILLMALELSLESKALEAPG